LTILVYVTRRLFGNYKITTQQSIIGVISIWKKRQKTIALAKLLSGMLRKSTNWKFLYILYWIIY